MVVDEKGAIAAECSGDGFEDGMVEVEVEHAVEGAQCEGCVGRASSEAGAGGYGFVEVYFDGWDFAVFGERSAGAYAEVVVGCAVDAEACLLECEGGGGGYFEDVAWGVERIEGCFYVMVSVGTFIDYVQAEVYFDVGEDDHVVW